MEGGGKRVYYRKKVTFKEISKNYLDSPDRKRKTWYRRIKDHIHHLNPFFGDYSLDKLKKSMIKDYRDKRKEEPIKGRKNCVTQRMKQLIMNLELHGI